MATGLFTLKQVNQAISQGAWSGYIAPRWVEYLVVAGGGAGGYIAGGGGAGGLLTGIVTVTAGTSYSVTVGGGGAGGTGGAAGSSGVNSVFGSISATGGGAGGAYPSAVGVSGGSGGGANNGGSGVHGTVGQGISGQGNAGGLSWAGSNYTGGGGGGAGTVGLNSSSGNSTPAGNGGAGIASAINGTVTVYAGGGGGAADTNGTGGSGGVGGGGAGGISRGATGGSGSVNSVAGSANTGGGSGGYGIGGSSGTGGSGIVIVSYPDVYAAATTVNATASTSGSGSLFLNGSNQYITYPSNSAFAFGTGSFTIEAWIYPTSTSGYRTIFTTRGVTSNAVYFGLDTGALYPVLFTSGGVLTSSIAVSLNAWSHVALVRSGTVVTIYVNGVSGGSATSVTDFTQTACVVGYEYSTSQYPWFGYISNLRVVKGTAIYTSTFTPSTTPLTAVSGTSLLLNTISGAYITDSSANSFVPTSTTVAGSWNQLSPFTGTGYKNRVYTWTTSGTITF